MKQWFNRIKKYNWTFVVVWVSIFTLSFTLWYNIFKIVKNL